MCPGGCSGGDEGHRAEGERGEADGCAHDVAFHEGEWRGCATCCGCCPK
jgi:hypothetical protein